MGHLLWRHVIIIFWGMGKVVNSFIKSVLVLLSERMKNVRVRESQNFRFWVFDVLILDNSANIGPILLILRYLFRETLKQTLRSFMRLNPHNPIMSSFCNIAQRRQPTEIHK